MDKEKLMDMALEKIIGELDDVEGRGAMAHSLEECPDPLNCNMHDGELGDSLTPDGGVQKGEPAAVKIEVSKLGLPTMDGEKNPGDEEKAEDGLSPEEAEQLRKLLR